MARRKTKMSKLWIWSGYSKMENNRYYMCSHRLNNIDACDGVGALIAEDVEAILYEALQKKIAELGTLTNQSSMFENPKLGELKIKIAQCQKDIENLVSKLELANATLMRYINEKIQEIDGNMKSLEQELRQLEDQKRSTSIDLNEINDCMQYWEKLSNQDKLTVVDAFIVSISASKDEISIHWKF